MGQAIKANKEKMATQLEELWSYAEEVASEELKDKRPTDFKLVDPEQVKQNIASLNEALKDK
jgi:hypothetical protein